MNDTNTLPFFNPMDQQTIVITYEDILNNYSQAFLDKMFFFWIIIFVYVTINTYRFKFFKTQETLDFWEEYSHTIPFIISAFYSILYIYYEVL